MHKILFYNKFIIFLYIFRALLCSSSGGQNCIIQHLVSSHSVGVRPVHRLGGDSLNLCTGRPSTNLMIPVAVKYNFDLLMMSRWSSKHVETYYLLTYSMVQSPSWEPNWFAASQEIPRIFMEPEGSLPHSQAQATCPYPVPAQSSPHTHIQPPGDPS